jgi:predicted DNA-binding protein (MmcQ/YjbR family)
MFKGLMKKLPTGLAAAPVRSEAYERIRTLCLGLPGVGEVVTPEQTAFKIGQRAFVVIETYRDPEGHPFNSLAFKASFFDYERLSTDPAHFPAPYLGGAGWLGRRLDDGADGKSSINWADLETILIRSHRQIAGRATGVGTGVPGSSAMTNIAFVSD